MTDQKIDAMDSLRLIMDSAFETLLAANSDTDLLECVAAYCAEVILKIRPDREAGIAEATGLIREIVKEADELEAEE